jgi:putative transposase
VIRSYRYSLRPTQAQTRTLAAWIGLTRELYNAALQERRDAWVKQRIRISMYTQMAQLPAVRAERREFADIPIVVLRGVLRRLDRAFSAFFRRCKSGETPGYPRFKGRGHFESLLLDDLGRSNSIVCGGRRVAVPLLGKVKVKLHRPLEGRPKALRIKRDHAGWWVTFACIGVSTKPLPVTDAAVGIDLGLTSFIATSDGDTIPNERPGGRAQKRLARSQRRVARRHKGSQRRRQAVRLLARDHAHVAAQRRERSIVLARALVARYGTVIVEKLNVKGLARSALARSVNDAAWGGFLWWLHVKAEEAGREVVEIDPYGTSQECPACGQVVAKTLAQRIHRCDCGLVCDRDVASAKVILGRGLRLRGGAVPVRTRRRSAQPKLCS